MRVVLGIDTSNYTTSLCLLGEDGQIKSDQRRILKVASGARGLRQSEALFQHVQNLPELAENIALASGNHTIVALGVSTQPRPQAESYMPVFLPGLNLAKSIGHLFNLPYYELSHQETHLWSGIASAGGPTSSEFLAIHLSGGTTEFVFVQQDEVYNRFAIELWGATSDLHAGQLVDRLGVRLGLDFPAGPALEKLALNTIESIPISTFQRDGVVSFSGPLTALERRVGEIEDSILARSCLQAIARTLRKWIDWAGQKTNCRQLLIVGGVAANSIVREELIKSLPAWQLYFASPQYSVDNAYGAAYYAALREKLITLEK